MGGDGTASSPPATTKRAALRHLAQDVVRAAQPALTSGVDDPGGAFVLVDGAARGAVRHTGLWAAFAVRTAWAADGHADQGHGPDDGIVELPVGAGQPDPGALYDAVGQ
ncbi:MAG: hypothetical protein OXF98_11060 [Rhodospirillaceae bacterium]|nr:hypothetical protein [Rhodospirillaceae bacterium]